MKKVILSIIWVLVITGCSKPDFENNFEVAQKASKEGNPKAQFYLADMYLSGNNISRDKEQALYWFTQSAEQGDSSAQLSLAEMYWSSRFKNVYPKVLPLKADAIFVKKALHWFIKSAEQGNAKAKHQLAGIYSQGVDDIIPEDDVKALKFGTEAAVLGYDRSQRVLASRYQEGVLVSKDYIKAVYWYTKAAEQGNRRALSQLVRMYYKGDGVKMDHEKAYRWAYLTLLIEDNEKVKKELDELFQNLPNNIIIKARKKASELYEKIMDRA